MPRSARRLALQGAVLLALLVAGCRCSGTARQKSSRPATSKPAPPETVKRLRLVTWNVLADPIYAKIRVPAILRLLRESRADILALQEVAPWFGQALLREPWVRKRYDVPREGDRALAPGGQLFLVHRRLGKIEATWAVLPGRQRRTVLEVHLRVNGRRLSLATTHMESYLEDGPVRAQQLDRMFARLKPTDDAVLLGDFNFGDREEPETGRLDRRYVDVWLALHPGKPGFTWDMARNPLAQVGAFKKERSRRLDRVLVRSPRWRPDAIRILGDGEVGRAVWKGHPPAHAALLGDGTVKPGQEIAVFPSDHYGLVVELVWR